MTGQDFVCIFIWSQNHCSLGINKNASFNVISHGSRQGEPFDIPPLGDQVFGVMTVIYHLDALGDDRPFVEVVVDVVRGRADQFHALVVSLVIGLGPLETRQQGVMDVDRLAIEFAAQLR